MAVMREGPRRRRGDSTQVFQMETPDCARRRREYRAGRVRTAGGARVTGDFVKRHLDALLAHPPNASAGCATL